MKCRKCEHWLDPAQECVNYEIVVKDKSYPEGELGREVIMRFAKPLEGSKNFCGMNCLATWILDI